MIICQLSRLRREKSLRDNRDISLRAVAREAGLSMQTIQRISRGEIERVYLSTLNALCVYFEVKEVGQLLQFVPEEVEVKT